MQASRSILIAAATITAAAATAHAAPQATPSVSTPVTQLTYGATGVSDGWGVVISGVAVNGVPGSQDVQLPVGSFWFQKGGERHVTKCISPNECLFFISQRGRFDYVVSSPKQ